MVFVIGHTSPPRPHAPRNKRDYALALTGDAIMEEAQRRFDAEQRAEAERKAKLYTDAEMQCPFEFRGAALELQSCKFSALAIVGPSETGKTVAALWFIHLVAMRWPGAQILVVRKIHKEIYGTLINTYKKRILNEAQDKTLGYGVTAYGGEKPEWYEYRNGSRVYFGGLDNPGKHLSGEFDFVYVNQAEQITFDDYQMLTTRVTGRAGNAPWAGILLDANPGPPNHWIMEQERAGNIRVLYSHHEDNPRLHDGNDWTAAGKESLSRLDKLTGVLYKRLRLGLWVSAEGTVYEFDRSIHLIDPFPIPPTWRRIRVVDFGYTNPFVMQWWAIDPDGRMYMYREIYYTRRLVSVHATQTNSLSEHEQGKFEANIADHDAEGRATLAAAGIGTIAANKAITLGIQAVQARLKVAGDGKPRLFIMRGATVEYDDDLAAAHLPTSTETEFDVYVWPKGADGKPVKETPVDMYNHGMDAMRYAVMYVDGGAQNIGDMVQTLPQTPRQHVIPARDYARDDDVIQSKWRF